MKLNRIVWCAVAVLMLQGIAAAARASELDAIVHRLNALEKENAGLRQRLNRIEHASAMAAREPRWRNQPRAPALDYPAPAPAAAFYKSPPVAQRSAAPHFEISGSLLFLQPGAGNLEYATLVSPLPVPTPNWANQALSPNFAPAFSVGGRYMPNESNDIELNWTHLNTTANASVAATPAQMVGPPYEIGPASAVFSNAQGRVNFAYDAVNLDAGHTFCADCAFQLRAFGGVEVARIGQTVAGSFESADGLTTASNTTTSLFTGAGPRLGVKGQYDFGNLQFVGEVAGAGLIGTMQSRINFAATSPLLGPLGIAPPNTQALTSPNATQLIPSVDARLAAAYVFRPSDYGQFRIEAGYRAAAYFDAINQYSLSLVAAAASTGVYLGTAQRQQSTFTDQGPYVTGSWAF
jgi:hypothetical protein